MSFSAPLLSPQPKSCIRTHAVQALHFVFPFLFPLLMPAPFSRDSGRLMDGSCIYRRGMVVDLSTSPPWTTQLTRQIRFLFKTVMGRVFKVFTKVWCKCVLVFYVRTHTVLLSSPPIVNCILVGACLLVPSFSASDIKQDSHRMAHRTIEPLSK